jgi:PAS domain S-box-containing protein
METFAEQIALFRAAADASYDWEEWIDPEGNLLYISPACNKITGYSPEEFLANPLLAEEIIHPADNSKFTSYTNQVTVDPTEAHMIDYRVIHRNGEVRWIEHGDQPVFDPKGQYVGRRRSYRDITRHKQTEEELRQSHQVIQALLQAATDAITVIDPEGNILLCNQKLSQRIGKNTNNVKGANLWAVFPPEVAEFRKKIVDQAFLTGQPVRTDDRGSLTNSFYDTVVYPIRNKEGRVDKAAIWAHDITERKRAEEEIRNQRQLLEVLLDGLMEIVIVSDPTGKILLANKVAAQKLETSLEELIGKKVFDLLPPEIAENRKRIGTQVIETGESVRIQERGIAGLYDSVYHPVKDEQGKVEKVAALSYDITELKNTEEELKKSEALYRSLVETSPDAIVFNTLENHFLAANRQFVKLFGYESLEEMKTSGLTGYDLLTRQDNPGIDQLVKGLIKTGRTRDNQYIGRSKDGSAFPLEVSSSVVLDNAGEAIGIISTARDISERIKAQEALRQNDLLLRTVVNSAPMVIVALNQHGIITLAEGNSLSRFGYQSSDLVGKDGFEMIDDLVKKNVFEMIGDRPEAIHHLRRALVGEELSAQYKTIWGSIIEIQFQPMLDNQNNVSGVIALAIDITQIKQTQEELAESEERFRNIYEQSPIGIELYDEKGRLLDANQACLDIFGVEDAMKIRGFELFNDPNLPEFAKTKLLDGDTVRFDAAFDFEKVKANKLYETRYSGIIYLDVQITPISGVGHDHPVKYLGQVQDITERKQAQEALQRSEQVLRTVINNSPVILAAMDEQGTITLAEGKPPAAVGFEAGDLVGKNALELIGGLPEGAKQIQRILAGEEFSDQYRSKRGAVFEFRYKPMFDQQKNYTGAIMVAVDVTGYTRAQEELRQSRNQLEVILNGSAESIVALDPEKNVIFANQLAASRYNYPSGEALAQDKEFPKSVDYFDEAGNLIPREQRPWYSALEGIACPPTIIHYYAQGEERARWIVIQSTPVFDENGKIQMGVVIAHDITDLKNAQQELEDARQDLERRVEERTLELAQTNQHLRDEIEMRKQAEKTIRQKVAHSEALARVAARVNAILDLKSVMQTISEETASALNYPGASIMLFNEEADCFEMVANTLGMVTDGSVSISNEKYKEYSQAYGPVIVIPDISTFPKIPYPELVAMRQTRSIVSVPLMHDGKTVGNLNVNSLGEIRLPTEDEIKLLKGFADQASIAIANARLFKQISENNIRLKALSEKLVKIQEEERRTLSRELHDEIGQMLTSLSLNCDIILKSLKGDEIDLPKITSEFKRTKKIVNQLVTQVRKLSLDLRPGMLDDLGLLPALLDHFERFSSQTNIKVQFKHHGVKSRYSSEVETAAFRIIQEALTNVARHANVSSVSINLWVDQGFLLLKVEDQGIGFDLEAIEKANTSVGISSMRERANLCGGELEIETTPGRGTCLTAELPLDNEPMWSENVNHDTVR